MTTGPLCWTSGWRHGASLFPRLISTRGAHGDVGRAGAHVEHAFAAEPADERVRAVRATLYRARAKAETSLMAKGIYNAAVRDSEGESKD